MITVLFRFFLLVYGRTILVLQIFFINLPLKLFNFNFMVFFLKIILILNLEEKFGWTGEQNIFRLDIFTV